MNIQVVIADYNNPQHADDLINLLNDYACDPMGGGEPLPQHVKDNLAAQLAKLPHAFSVIAYVDDKPAGLINCFEVFSTFNCKPLVNIHDVIVSSNFRGLGLSQTLLNKVEEIARQRGCCKLTLELLQGNKTAKNAYLKFGFKGYELDPAMGEAMFWQKSLA